MEPHDQRISMRFNTWSHDIHFSKYFRLCFMHECVWNQGCFVTKTDFQKVVQSWRACFAKLPAAQKEQKREAERTSEEENEKS